MRTSSAARVAVASMRSMRSCAPLVLLGISDVEVLALAFCRRARRVRNVSFSLANIDSRRVRAAGSFFVLELLVADENGSTDA